MTNITHQIIKANTIDWTPSDNDVNAGSGQYGTCCNEMDIWEANSMAAAVTPHVCSVQGQTRCSGTDCGDGDERYDGICDKDGCDFNSFRMGDKSFLGPGLTVDTNSVITVVTQFITSDNTTSGDLVEIRRIYVQDGTVIQNSKTNIAGLDTYDSITDDFCNAQKTVFGDTNSFENQGGLKVMGDSFEQGMVLVMSLWDDHAVDMLWLDSDYPTTSDPSTPGVARGNCPTTSGAPTDVEANAANSYVIYSNIKYGPIGSTFSGTSSGSTTTTTSTTSKSTTTTTTTSTASGATQTHYGQCGGTGYTCVLHRCMIFYYQTFLTFFFQWCDRLRFTVHLHSCIAALLLPVLVNVLHWLCCTIPWAFKGLGNGHFWIARSF